MRVLEMSDQADAELLQQGMFLTDNSIKLVRKSRSLIYFMFGASRKKRICK